MRSSSEIQPVSVGPGLMQLARIPRTPSSDAAAMTMRSRRALADAIGDVVGERVAGECDDAPVAVGEPVGKLLDEQRDRAGIDREMSIEFRRRRLRAAEAGCLDSARRPGP